VKRYLNELPSFWHLEEEADMTPILRHTHGSLTSQMNLSWMSTFSRSVATAQGLLAALTGFTDHPSDRQDTADFMAIWTCCESINVGLEAGKGLVLSPGRSMERDWLDPQHYDYYPTAHVS